MKKTIYDIHSVGTQNSYTHTMEILIPYSFDILNTIIIAVVIMTAIIIIQNNDAGILVSSLNTISSIGFFIMNENEAYIKRNVKQTEEITRETSSIL